MMRGREHYSLRQVVELTGLSEFTLRGWENRYAAFRPERTETGRREYSAKDLRRALLLRELTGRGCRIGEIARLSEAKLGSLLESSDLEAGAPAAIPEVAEALRLASLQKWEELEACLRMIGRRRSALSVATDFVAPLLAGMSALVDLKRFSIAQEHMLSSLVRDLLYALQARAPEPRASARRIVIASPEGDYHELGILIARVLLTHHGFRSLYLGSNSPKEDLCDSAIQFGATHVLLGATVHRPSGARESLPSFIHFLDVCLPAKVTLWIGGREGGRFPARLTRPHAVFRSIRDFEAALRP